MDHRLAIQTAMAAAAGEQPPQAIVPRHYHWLLQLPARFWSEMHYYLDYPEILGLRLLSSQFNEHRVEEFLPWTVRHAFVAHLERTTRRESRSACYLCFRIRGSEHFHQAKEMATYARVVQRDWYRGSRVFEKVSPPSPDQQFSIVCPPSPLEMVAGSSFQAPSGEMPQIGVNMSMGASMTINMDANMGGGMGLVPVRNAVVGGGGVQAQRAPMRVPIPTALFVQRLRWWSRAPGADVGKVESLRRYCAECAIRTQLLSPGDLVTIGTDEVWLCYCRLLHHKKGNLPCSACGMNPVYRPLGADDS